MNLLKQSPISIFVLTITAIAIIMMGCSDDPASSEPDGPDGPSDEIVIEFTPEVSAQIIYEYFVEMGLIPSEGFQSKQVPLQTAESGINEWVEIEETDDGWKLNIYLTNVEQRDDDSWGGELIPTNEWYEANSAYCNLQYRMNKTPDTVIEIIITKTSRVAPTRVVDLETGNVIWESQFKIEDGDIEGFKEYVAETYEELLIEQFEHACGLFEGPISIHFQSLVETEVITPEITAFINSGVKSEIQLEYSKETDQYLGESVLSHYLYENTLVSELGCSYNLTDAVIRIEMDVDNFASVSELNLYITRPVTGDQAPAASVSCGQGFGSMDAVSTMWFPVFVLLHQDDVDSEREAFMFSGWEDADDSDVLGLIEFENSADFTDFDESFSGSESMPVTEQTRIEIRPNP